MDAKKSLRNHFLNQRNKIYQQTDFNVQEVAKQASQHITAYLKKTSGIWGSYRPINTEFDPCMIESNNKHLIWTYPKIKKDILEFRRILNPQNIWQKNHLGIEEPSDTSSEIVPIEQLEGILCPTLAVDLKGNRLGYGKGYYDRTLSGFEGHKVALIFSAQISKQVLPTTKNDVAMNWILTENDFWGCHP